MRQGSGLFSTDAGTRQSLDHNRPSWLLVHFQYREPSRIINKIHLPNAPDSTGLQQRQQATVSGCQAAATLEEFKAAARTISRPMLRCAWISLSAVLWLCEEKYMTILAAL